MSARTSLHQELATSLGDSDSGSCHVEHLPPLPKSVFHDLVQHYCHMALGAREILDVLVDEQCRFVKGMRCDGICSLDSIVGPACDMLPLIPGQHYHLTPCAGTDWHHGTLTASTPVKIAVSYPECRARGDFSGAPCLRLQSYASALRCRYVVPSPLGPRIIHNRIAVTYVVWQAPLQICFPDSQLHRTLRSHAFPIVART